jgi:penicillin amidase
MFDLRKILAIIITSLFFLLSFYIFLNYITNASLPDEGDKVSSDKISSNIKIFHNYYGIPHIITQNNDDMFFALGYIHAKDRLWQMDYLRRIAKGRLSAIYGNSTMSIDLFFRLLSLEEIANKSYKLLDKPTLNALKHYSDGINFYVNQNKKALPIEFNIFDYQMEEWQPIDCLILFKLFSFKQSQSFFMDVIIGMIAEKIGVENALELIPRNLHPPYILSQDFQPHQIPQVIKANEAVNDSLSNDSLFYKTFMLIGGAFDLIGKNVPLTGTNCWASKVSHNKQSYSILANDFHSALYLPNQWYQVHLSSAKANIIGLSMPGIPFIFSGRNEHISWGMSNMMLDDCDFFIHEISAEAKESFVTPDGPKKFDLKKDTIFVKDSVDVHFYKFIANGAIVISESVFLSDIKTGFNIPNSELIEDFSSKYYLTFNWVGFEPSSELNSLYRIIFAENWTQFKRALNNWGTPATNFVFADKRSNIGLIPKGFVPIREENCNPNIPNPGWEDGYSWVRLEKNFAFGNLYNPKKNFVAAANNPISDQYKTHLSSYFEPPARAQRIEEYFHKIKDYQAKDAKQLQSDLLSIYALDFKALTIPELLENYHEFNFDEREAFRIFRDWDCIMSPLSPEASFYKTFLEQVIKNVFGVYLNEENLSQIKNNSNMLYVRLLEILSTYENNFSGFDKSELNRRINISFSNAVIQTSAVFKTKSHENWQYGKINQIELDHFLSNLVTFDRIVKIGPFEVGGDFSTLNYCQNSASCGSTSCGRTASMIINMSDSLVYTSLAGGSSGQPISPHYSDQIQLWLNGGYIALPINNFVSNDFDLLIEIVPE